MKRRTTRMYAVAVLVCVCSFAAMTGAMAASPVVLADIPWGSGADEIGLLDMPEVETVGPKNFTVDDGKVYILDYVNKALKEFDLKSRKAGVVAKGIAGSSLCVGADGSILVLQGDTVTQVGKDGKVKAAVSVASELDLIEGYGQDVSIKDGKDVMVNRPDGKAYAVASLGAKGLQKAAKVQQLASECPAGVGIGYDVKYVDKETVRLLKYDAKNEVVDTADIKTDDVFGGVQVKGVDNAGNVYIECERITADNYVHLEIRKVRPDGTQVDVLELLNTYYTTVYKKTEVDAAGNIYQMATEQSGVKILLWKM